MGEKKKGEVMGVLEEGGKERKKTEEGRGSQDAGEEKRGKSFKKMWGLSEKEKEAEGWIDVWAEHV